MARTVNQTAHARRRAELVDAVFRIVSRDGIEHVSVRNVAREAGLSSGTLRHYFATQAELLAFALGEVEHRLRARLAPIGDGQLPRRALEQVLRQLVPLTSESVVHHQIWLAFVAKAITDPALQSLNARVYDDLRELLRRMVQSVVRPEQDLEMEVERLYALVDGLVVHAALRPDQWSPERLMRVLTYHVESLAKRVRR
jgi:AcrR family transcriptional regulator